MWGLGLPGPGLMGRGRAAAGAGVEEQTTLTQMAPRRGAPSKRRMGEMQGQGWGARTEGRERLASPLLGASQSWSALSSQHTSAGSDQA